MRKNLLYISLILFLAACQTTPSSLQHSLTGYAQGSTFQIQYVAEPDLDLQSEVDSVFKVIDQSLSTYDPQSLISKINRKPDSGFVADKHFKLVCTKALEIARKTNGAFDPTVGPLVRLWGFDEGAKRVPDSSVVDSVKRFTGYQRLHFKGDRFFMPRGFRIDFNAIAQGYTVDVICKLMEAHGVTNYFVEVGGETRAAGQTIDGRFWRVGIDKPQEDLDAEDRLNAIVELRNTALATSGNYRKFWVDSISGLKYAHTIDPQTGYPARNKLLSTSILTDNCMEADAYATACMVMGTAKAIAFVEAQVGMEAYLIYTNEDDEWQEYISKPLQALLLDR